MDTTMESQQGSYDAPLETGPEPLTQSPHDAETEGYAPETVNLVEVIPEEDQKKLAAWVVKNYERDLKSSERFREKRASIVKMFIGMLPPLPDGEKGAQIHYPIIAVAVQRMHARVYDQQFPSNGEFFGVKPTDALDLERAIRVAKHMNWQIAHQIPEYVPNHDVLIMQWLLYGSAFSYMYWSPVKNRPCHEVCRTEDIILPYKRHSTDPSLADVPRITRVVRYYQHELEEMQDTGYFVNVDKLYDPENPDIQPSQSDQSRSSTMQETIDRAHGVEDDKNDPDSPRVLLDHHCWYKLPKDKRKRPLIVTVDLVKKVLLCVKLREDEDPEDRARYNREKAVIEAQYDAAMQQYTMDLAAYNAGQTQPPMMAGPPMGQDIPTETPPRVAGTQTMTAPPMPGATDMTAPGPAIPPPPTPPPKAPEPDAPRMVPIHFFTHYVCIPNPEGIYGFGIGYLLEGHNMVADVIASQMVDAGTLANTKGGVRSRQTNLRGGEFRFRPGEFVEVDVMPEQLDKAFKIFDFKGADPALGNFIKDQKEEAQELSGANEILSGEVGGSNETATTTQIRISQALAAIAILNKRYTRARSVEGQKLARLNSVHLGDEEYFTVVDPFKMPPPGTAPPAAPAVPGMPPAPPPGVSEEKVARMDYLEDVDITITADPRMASQPQRFQEAQQAWTLVNASPMLAASPSLMMAVARNLFVAMDRPDLVAALMTPTPPPPPGMQPPGGQPPPPAGQKPAPGGPPHPQPPGPLVPNAGSEPANQPFMGQGG